MEVFEEADVELKIKGPIPYRGFGDVGAHHDYLKLSISETPNLPAKFARAITKYRKLQSLWLWCEVFRTAMPFVISSPSLESLDVLSLRKPGKKLCSFSDASNLKVFRCGFGITDNDLLAVSSAPVLNELGVQNSCISSRSLNAILDMPNLSSIDLECSNLNNDLASQLSDSSQIETLEVGNTQITDAGLKCLSTMKQLKRLDIWETDVSINAIETLPELNNLEYLSLGGGEMGEPKYNADSLISILDSLPSLNNLWLDGVTLSDDQITYLANKYQTFRH